MRSTTLPHNTFVATSWNQPELTGDVTGLGVVRVLEAVRHFCPTARFYQASSSEMFGRRRSRRKVDHAIPPPKSYAVAKVLALCDDHYRESYGLYCCNGICFNHESRGAA